MCCGEVRTETLWGKYWKEMHQIVNSCFRENHVSCSVVFIFPKEPCHHMYMGGGARGTCPD